MNFKWKVNVRVIVRDLADNILEVKELHNLIPTVSLNKVRDFWEGLITDGKIIDGAVGRDNTAPALTDVGLGQETFRKPIVGMSEPGDGQLLTTVYIKPSEAVGLIEEMGWFSNFAVDDFWLAENDDFVVQETGDHIIFEGAGVLFSRVLYDPPHTKPNVESIQIERTDTIEEA